MTETVTAQFYEMERCDTASVSVFLIEVHIIIRVPGSSVGIETAYGLDGPGIESR